MKVTLELTKEQAETVARALDLYCRLGIGQVHELEYVLTRFWKDSPPMSAAKALSVAKNYLFPRLSDYASFSIANREVPLEFRRACDIEKCILQPLAIARDPNPKYPTVDYEGAILNVSDEPLPTVTVSE